MIWHDGAATRWWNSPFQLKEILFLGHTFHMPADPELYLDENYGDWRVPQKNFDARFDAPNAQITDKPYFDSLIYFSLLSSIIHDKQVMKSRYINYLSRIEPEYWLKRC